MANLTLIGLYNYDPTLFDNLSLPTGIDKSLLINELLMKCGEFELLYPNLDFMKYQIGKWGEKNYFTFSKWIEALAAEFNPIHNYDRYEEYEDSHNRASSDRSETGRVNTGTASQNATSDTTGNAATSNSAQTTNNAEVTRSVSAYDSTDYQPREKENTGGGNSTEGNAVTSENTKTINANSSSTSDTSNEQTTGNRMESENAKHTAHLYGNIGVTTSIAMLTEFTGFYKDFNLYEQIADLFVNEFCIRLY